MELAKSVHLLWSCLGHGPCPKNVDRIEVASRVLAGALVVTVVVENKRHYEGC